MGKLPLIWPVTILLLTAAGCDLQQEQTARLREEVKSRGLIVGFEGLQPFSGDRAGMLVRQVAAKTRLAQMVLSGNPWAALSLAAEAHKNRQPIYILGYSLGGNDADQLAELCSEANIPIQALFMLDPGAFGQFGGRIPRNVRRVVFYSSPGLDPSVRPKKLSEYLEDPNRTVVQFVEVNDTWHLDLPSRVSGQIAGVIENNRRK